MKQLFCYIISLVIIAVVWDLVKAKPKHVVRHFPRTLPASCIPTPQVVNFDFSNESYSRFIPTPGCTRVNRCSGCCPNSAFSCHPKNVIIRNLSVHLRNVVDGSDQDILQFVPVEEHLSCQCQCSQTKMDCSPAQFFIPSECRCTCKDTSTMAWCDSKHPIRRWDANLCTCPCREIEDCTEGTKWSNDTCGCVLDPDEIDSHKWMQENIYSKKKYLK